MREFVVLVIIAMIGVPLVLWRRSANLNAAAQTVNDILKAIAQVKGWDSTRDYEHLNLPTGHMYVVPERVGDRRRICISLGPTRGKFTAHAERVLKVLLGVLSVNGTPALPMSGDTIDEYLVYIAA